MTNKLSQKKLDEFKILIMQKMEEVLASVNAQPEDIDIDGDDVDLIQGKILNHINTQISLRDVTALKKLKRALDKINDGTFGICAECDEPIPEKRLKIMLSCELCINCAEENEALSKQFAK